jgi:hypothetical protein
MADPLQLVVPPEGVTLVGASPSKTGEGGRGITARYSDGTTCSAMVNSDGSVTILFFRGAETLPAIPIAPAPSLPPAPRRFTWSSR